MLNLSHCGINPTYKEARLILLLADRVLSTALHSWSSMSLLFAGPGMSESEKERMKKKLIEMRHEIRSIRGINETRRQQLGRVCIVCKTASPSINK